MSDKLYEEAPANRKATSAIPTRRQVFEAALAYVKGGLSMIPIRADGTKSPACELLPAVWSDTAGRYRRPWSGYKARLPSEGELNNWFWRSGEDFGIAILGGAVSGNLEIIDLDNWDVIERFMWLVARRAPDLLTRLVQVKTPRPGMHLYYRCDIIEGNQKLARVPDPKYDNLKPKTLIETKGEGGYCLAPPSPPGCHKSGRCYTFQGGRDLSVVPVITPAEREILLRCARALNCWNDPKRQPYVARPRPSANSRGGRPGDDFNSRAEWAEILQPHGWAWVGRGAESSDNWCRPGKAVGTSATTNFAGSDFLYVFSSNADPFEDGKAYTKFSAYALLNHQGDFRVAARALAAKGYGTAQQRHAGCPVPFARYSSYAVSPKRNDRGG